MADDTQTHWATRPYSVGHPNRAPFPHKKNVLMRWGFLDANGDIDGTICLNILIIVKCIDEDRDRDICKVLRYCWPSTRLIEPEDVVEIFDFFKKESDPSDDKSYTKIEARWKNIGTDNVDVTTVREIKLEEVDDLIDLPKLEIPNFWKLWQPAVRNVKKAIDLGIGNHQLDDKDSDETTRLFTTDDAGTYEREFYLDLSCYNDGRAPVTGIGPTPFHEASLLRNVNMENDKLHPVPRRTDEDYLHQFKLTRYQYGTANLFSQLPASPPVPQWAQRPPSPTRHQLPVGPDLPYNAELRPEHHSRFSVTVPEASQWNKMDHKGKK